MRRSLACVGIVAAVVLLGVPAGAGAAVEIGNECTATAGVGGTNVMTGTSNSNPHPIAAPTDGVLTKWRLRLPDVGPEAQRLKVVRRTATPSSLSVIGESTPVTVTPGTTSYDTRITVKAGDLIGLYGPISTFVCGTGTPADTVGAAAGDSLVGTTPTYSSTSSRALPLVATIEPDADRDGFGDETQDGCPASAATQGPCPSIALDSFSLSEKAAVKLLVSSTLQADVTVTAQATLPTEKGKGKRASTIVLLGPLTQTVTPPTIAVFRLPFPSALKSAVKKLPKGKSIKLDASATATGPFGGVSTTTEQLKLKGRVKKKKG